jgi:hypothetical protein
MKMKIDDESFDGVRGNYCGLMMLEYGFPKPS